MVHPLCMCGGGGRRGGLGGLACSISKKSICLLFTLPCGPDEPMPWPIPKAELLSQGTSAIDST
jgi:hypothetical protein